MKIYLAAPFAAWMGPDGLLAPQAQLLIIHIKAALERGAHEVKVPHEREDWGRNIYPPLKCTHLDFVEVQQAEGVIAIPQTSGGVHIELGWASALGKPILVLIDGPTTALLAGLSTITDATVREVDLASVEVVSELCMEWAATAEAKLTSKNALQTPRSRYVRSRDSSR